MKGGFHYTIPENALGSPYARQGCAAAIGQPLEARVQGLGNKVSDTVLVVGPSSSEVGGMASVVEQMLSLDLGPAFRPELFPFTRSPASGEGFLGRALRHLRHLSAFRAAVRRTETTLVHIHTCSGFTFFRLTLDLLIARRAGCRVILHIHGAKFDKFFAGLGWFGRKVVAWSLSRADRVIALSKTWRDALVRMAPHARVVVIENAVPIPADPSPRVEDHGCRFLLLSRMDEWKGIDDLLAASESLRTAGVQFEVILAGPPGSAGDANTLERKIEARGLEGVVRYVGTVHGEKKANLLRSADVYVQPSHHEGMPISLLEALASGLPVVATRVGAVPEVVADQREGLLVPPHRSELLAQAMRSLVEDVARRDAMADAARELAITRFSLDRFRDDLLSLYKELRAQSRTVFEAAETSDDSRPLLVGPVCKRMERPSAARAARTSRVERHSRA